MPFRRPLYRVALGLALAALSGCGVDQARESAVYRKVLDSAWPAPPPAPAPGEVLTLRQALALANAHNERLGLGGEDYLQALIERDRAASALLPSINLVPAYRRMEDFTAPGFAAAFVPNPATDVPVAASLRINMSDFAGLEKADVLARYRLAVLLDLQAGILVDTAETYYQVLRLERQAGVLGNSVAVQEARVRDMRDRWKAGVARPLDVAQTEAEAAGARASRVETRRLIAAARAALAFLVGVPAVENPLADGFDLPAVADLEALQKQAAGRREDLRAAQALVAAAEKGLRAAFAQYYPSVAVDFDYFLSRQSFPADSRWLFGVSANLPVFAGGRIHAGVRTAYSLMRQAHLYRSLTERRVTEEVKVAYENLRASEERLRELQAQVSAAKDAFGLSEQAFDVGLATNLERLITEDRLLQAELQLAAETLNRKILYLKLSRAVGRLVDEAPHLPARTDNPPAPAAPPAS